MPTIDGHEKIGEIDSATSGKGVERIYDALKALGANMYLDRHDLVAGSLQRQIAREIRRRQSVVLVLSKDSINSDWVENEVDMARELERERGRDVLCPIALDDSWKSRLEHGMPRRELWLFLKEKSILDFSEKADFDKEFKKLAKGLKLHYARPADGGA